MSTAFFETIARYALPVTVAFSAAQYSMYNVNPGHRAVLFDRVRGVLPQPVGEGTHFLIPWLQRAIYFDIRTKPRHISTTTGSKDLQTVSLTLRVLHRPETEQLASIYSKLGMDYDERVLPSIGNEILKSVVAQFDASELITQREQVSLKIRQELIKRAGEFHIKLEDVSITDLTFGKDFTDAVEQKVIAQQDAERARFVVERAEQEKLAGIIRAEGESQAAQLLSEAYRKNGQAHLELRRIETSKDIASTLAKSANVTWLPSSESGSNVLLNLNNK